MSKKEEDEEDGVMQKHLDQDDLCLHTNGLNKQQVRVYM